jgi:hypothetical protein
MVYMLTLRYVDPLGRLCRTRLVGTQAELVDMVASYRDGGCRKLRIVDKRTCEQRY